MLTSKAEYFSFIATFILIFSLVLNCKPEEKMPAREMEKQVSDEEVIDVDAKGKGTITGIVKFKGKVPERKKLKVTIDQYACGEEKLSEELVVSESGGLKNAVVYLTGISVQTDEQKYEAYQLDQRQCQFVPHVFLVPAGAKVEVLNSDNILHNFHTFSTKNSGINKNQPRRRKVMRVSFGLPEIIRLKCDVHSWMNGWVVVSEHPYYAITDENGTFKLENVPAGTYTLEVWQEVLGTQTKKITVEEDKETKVDIELSKS